jgi:hypothetical protein
MLATDGTYSNPQSIFTEYTSGSTHGGLSITSTVKPYPRVSGVRFEAPVTAKRVFTTELAAIALGLRLYSGTLHSDCQGAIAAANIGTVNALAAQCSSAADRVVWVRSHPESRKSVQNWTPQDGAIHAADTIAADNDFETMTFSDTCNTIFARSRNWVLIGANGALLESPLKIKQEQDLTTYLSGRSKHGRSIWCQEGLQLLTSTADTLPQRVALTKLYLGQYQADLQFESGTRPICSCGCRNILTDWLSVCQREDVLQLNKAFLPILSALNIPRQMALVLYTMLTASDNVRLFRGNWSSESRESIEAARLRTHDATIRTWRKGMLCVTKCLTSHSLDLYHLVNSTPTPAVTPQPLTLPTSLEIYLNFSSSSSQPAVDAQAAVSQEVFSTPFSCNIRPNPSSKPPPTKSPTVKKTLEKARRHGRKSHSITEYFRPILRPQVQSADEVGNVRNLKSLSPSFSMKTQVVLLRPHLRPDIRTHFQAIGTPRSRQVSTPAIAKDIKDAKEAKDPRSLPHDPGPPDPPARIARHGILSWLTSPATYPT